MLPRYTEIALWCALGLSVPASLLSMRGCIYSNDGYQYLSTASNISSEHSIATSIVHFDSERTTGRIPAPLTTFPAGYPVSIAVLNQLGVDPPRGAVVVSAVSAILLIPLVWAVGTLFGLTRLAIRVALVLLIANSCLAVYSAAIATELLFTTLSLGGLLLLLRYEAAPDRTSTAALMAGCALLGCAYWVRYAGLFLVAAVAAFYAVRLLLVRERAARKPLFGVALALAMVAAGFARNLYFSGSWKGGNTKPVSHAFLTTVKATVLAIWHLFLGGATVSSFALGKLTLAAGVALLGFVALRLRRCFKLSGLQPAAMRPLTLLAVYLVTYCVGMFYSGLTSVISYGARMFLPMLPLWAITFGFLVSTLDRASSGGGRPRLVFRAALCLTILGYVAINLGNLIEIAKFRPAPHQAVEARLAGPMQDGGTVRSWIDANIPSRATIVSSDGQATGFALRRKTVSLVPAEYSEQNWDEAALHRLMARYGAEYLILYPKSSDPVQMESAFLKTLLRGEVPPWLSLAAANPEVRVFRRAAPAESL